MKPRETLPGHLIFDIFDSELSVSYLLESYEEWRGNWRQVPAYVSNCFESIAIRFEFDLHLMDEQREQILEEIKEAYPDVWQYLHPEGTFSKYHYDYARSAFWCRYQFRSMGISEEAERE